MDSSAKPEMPVQIIRFELASASPAELNEYVRLELAASATGLAGTSR